MFKINKILIFVLIIFPLFFIASCSQKPPSEQIAVKINDYTLTTGEFNELFSRSSVSVDTSKGRKEFLNNLIICKLILQEAEREGLDRKEEFLNSIEDFWEQSLLTITVDKKTLEIYNKVTVTDKEIEDAFEKWVEKNPENTKTLDDMRDFIHKQLLNVKQSLAFNSWVQALKSKAQITVDKKALGVE